MHGAVRANILPYFAEAPEEDLLRLPEDHLNMALLEFAKHVLALEAILQVPEPGALERSDQNPG